MNKQHLEKHQLNNLTNIKTGDLLWCKISKYCYWPCIVYPHDNHLIIEHGKSKKLHVKFCYDDGRRSLMFTKSLFHFNGPQDWFYINYIMKSKKVHK